MLRCKHLPKGRLSSANAQLYTRKSPLNALPRRQGDSWDWSETTSALPGQRQPLAWQAFRSFACNLADKRVVGIIRTLEGRHGFGSFLPPAIQGKSPRWKWLQGTLSQPAKLLCPKRSRVGGTRNDPKPQSSRGIQFSDKPSENSPARTTGGFALTVPFIINVY